MYLRLGCCEGGFHDEFVIFFFFACKRCCCIERPAQCALGRTEPWPEHLPAVSGVPSFPSDKRGWRSDFASEWDGGPLPSGVF